MSTDAHLPGAFPHSEPARFVAVCCFAKDVQHRFAETHPSPDPAALRQRQVILVHRHGDNHILSRQLPLLTKILGAPCRGPVQPQKDQAQDDGRMSNDHELSARGGLCPSPPGRQPYCSQCGRCIAAGQNGQTGQASCCSCCCIHQLQIVRVTGCLALVLEVQQCKRRFLQPCKILTPAIDLEWTAQGWGDFLSTRVGSAATVPGKPVADSIRSAIRCGNAADPKPFRRKDLLKETLVRTQQPLLIRDNTTIRRYAGVRLKKPLGRDCPSPVTDQQLLRSQI